MTLKSLRVHRPARRSLIFIMLAGALAVVMATARPALAAREEGVDVSEWQGIIDWTQVKESGRSFAFIRATRGGTTGSSGGGGLNTVGMGRYDDPRFIDNITGAKNAGLIVGPYHYARTDIAGSSPEDEAAHFLEIAGPYMSDGYLRPVLDLEAGEVETTTAQLTEWALRFCNRIAAVKGEAARPIIYTNRHFANTQLTDSMTIDGKKLSDHPLWLADWDTFNYATSQTVDPQTDPTPPPFYLGADNPRYPNPLGIWGPDTGTMPKTWAFWQYGVKPPGTVPGIGTSIDVDVFHSEAGSIRSMMIPEPVGLPFAAAAALLMLARRQRRHRGF